MDTDMPITCIFDLPREVDRRCSFKQRNTSLKASSINKDIVRLHINMLNSAGAFVLVITAVLGRIIYSHFYSNTLAARKRALAHIPELRFDKDDTPERYRKETRSLVRKGYEKYLQYGIPFQMHNPVGELGNQVVLPIKYLDEVKRAPRSLFSFEAFSEKLFLLSYIDAPRQTDALLFAAKLDINKNIGE